MKNLSRGKFPVFVVTAGLVLLFIFSPFPLGAASPLDVVINEIAWMGTVGSAADEWMELYNNTAATIDLTDWKVEAGDGSPAVELSGEISPSGFFILERTDDNTLPKIPADQIYTGALNNGGEQIRLLMPDGRLIDKLDCTGGWFYGDNATKRTMERKVPEGSGDSKNWQSSFLEGGTPGRENSQGLAREIIQVPDSGSSPGDIVLTELLPSPSGRDEDEEWIELLNQDSYRVSLADWKLIDQAGRTKTYAFGPEAAVEPGEFIVLSRRETGITLNNEGDGLYLIGPDGKKIDQVSYGKAPTGESYSLINGEWGWTGAPTPGEENILPNPDSREQEMADLSSKEQALPSSVPEKASGTKQALAFKTFNAGFVNVFLTAFLTSCVSAAAVLIWKNFLRRGSEAADRKFDF